MGTSNGLQDRCSIQRCSVSSGQKGQKGQRKLRRDGEESDTMSVVVITTGSHLFVVVVGGEGGGEECLTGANAKTPNSKI